MPGIRPREQKTIPENYEDLVAEWEAAKSEYESYDRMMEEYAREHNYRNYADDSWYQILCAEQYRAWQWYQELDKKKAPWSQVHRKE